MNTNEIKNIIFIVSTVFGVAVVTTHYLKNLSYNIINRQVGIKKNNKGNTVLELILKIINYILGIEGALLFIFIFDKSGGNNSKLSEMKILLLYAILGIVWVTYMIRTKKVTLEINKYFKQYNYQYNGISKWISKKRFAINVIVDLLLAGVGVFILKISGLDSFNLIAYCSYMLICYVITIVWYGYEDTLYSINRLKEHRIVYSNLNKNKVRFSKIIYSDDKYTLILTKNNDDAKLEYINNSNIISISSI